MYFSFSVFKEAHAWSTFSYSAALHQKQPDSRLRCTFRRAVVDKILCFSWSSDSSSNGLTQGWDANNGEQLLTTFCVRSSICISESVIYSIKTIAAICNDKENHPFLKPTLLDHYLPRNYICSHCFVTTAQEERHISLLCCWWYFHYC